MRKIVIILCALLSFVVAAAQPVKQIREVEILVELRPNGDAWITQYWDVEAGSSGTEFYIPIGNLGPMSISDLHVWDGEEKFESLGTSWDVDKSRSWKTGKCGIVPKKDGVELCWGLGEPGDHVWAVLYYVSGLVQAYEDADAFNFMFVNKGMNPAPKKASVTIVPYKDLQCDKWTSDNVRVWAFGYSGEINVKDGAVVAETDDAMDSGNCLIALVKFDKGIFQPTVKKNEPFQNLLDRALDGSSYGQEESDGEGEGVFWLFVVGLLGLLGWGGWAGTTSALGYKWKEKMFGTHKIDGWWRSAPLDGNLFAAHYVLSKGKRFAVDSAPANNLIGAFFLRWIMDGHVAVQPDPKSEKRVNLLLKADNVSDDAVEQQLYEMALAAAGANRLLERGEFEKWASRNYYRVTGWPQRAIAEGIVYFKEKGYWVKSTEFTLDGQKEACHVVEFQNFLKNFTLSDQREANEVKLWKDYLVFAQLYGIAEKVTSQFKKLYPKEFEELARQTGVSSNTLLYTALWTNSISSRAFSNATARAGSASGGGGRASFGGGGGFSGGGFGGGGR